MASKKKDPLFWLGHPVRDDEHAHDLHLKAAVYEFHHGVPRHEAEERVKHEDRVERHQQAAAHHLDGVKASNAIGNSDAAKRHHSMYSLHMKALGHDPYSPVPPEVKRWTSHDKREHLYDFTGHDDDHFLVQPVKKSEDGDIDAQFVAHVSDVRKAGAHFLKNPNLLREAVKNLHALMDRHGIDRSQTNFIISSYAPGTKQMAAIQGGGQVTPPKYGHLRVVKAEDWKHIISLLPLLKAWTAKPVREFAADRTWMRSKHDPEERAFDYSGLLTEQQHKAGYRMFVLSHGRNNPVRVHVVHGNQRAGGANGNVQEGDLEVESYHLRGAPHQGKGLEASMLNAMMHHAKQHHAATTLSHAEFTPEASAFIEAVAKPHGLELGDLEDVDEPPSRPHRPDAQGAMTLATGGIKAKPKKPTPRIHMWWAGPND